MIIGGFEALLVHFGTILNKNDEPVDEVVELYRLRFLGHVLSMPVHRLPKRTTMTGVRVGRKKAKGGQTKT